MNLSTLASPIHMSTPTDTTTKRQRKRLSEGGNPTPKVINQKSQGTTSRDQRSRSALSPVAACNNNVHTEDVHKGSSLLLCNSWAMDRVFSTVK